MKLFNIDDAIGALDNITQKAKGDVKGAVPAGFSAVRKANAGVEDVDGTIVHKAGEFLSTALASGGALVPEQQNRFLDTVIEESRMLSLVRTHPMVSTSMLIERMAFTTRFLKPLTEFVAPASSISPTLAKIELATFEYGGLLTVGYNTLQDSIEGGRNVRGNSIEDHLIRAIARACARDIEHYVLNSDTASADPDLIKFDGALKLASATYSHAGAPVSKLAFKKTLQALAKKFRQNLGAMRWFYGPGLGIEWRDEFADRGTAFGDEAMSDLAGVERRYGAYGIPATVVTLIPEDLGAGTDETKILTSNPLNLNVGLWREVFFDWQKDVATRSLKIMVTVRFGFKYEDPDGASVGSDIKVA